MYQLSVSPMFLPDTYGLSLIDLALYRNAKSLIDYRIFDTYTEAVDFRFILIGKLIKMGIPDDIKDQIKDVDMSDISIHEDTYKRLTKRVIWIDSLKEFHFCFDSNYKEYYNDLPTYK